MSSKQPPKTIATLAPGDRFKLGKSPVEVISNTPRDHRISVLQLLFLKTGQTELRTFISHHQTEITK